MSFDNVGWVESNTGLTLNTDQARCIDTLCSIERPYNLPLIGDRWAGVVLGPVPDETDDMSVLPPERAPVEIWDHFIVVRIWAFLSTFDFDELTRLVLAAHRNAVRVQMSPQMYRAVAEDSTIFREVKDLATGTYQLEDTGEHPAYPATCLRVQLNSRQHNGRTLYDTHPTIEQALARHAPEVDRA